MTTPTSSDELIQICHSRRNFLTKGAAVAMGTVVTGACGGSLYGPGEGGGSGGGATVTGTFRLADYPALATVGGIAKLTGNGLTPVALVHISANTYAAFSMACPHAGTTINVSGGSFVCPNHGALFAADGTWTGGRDTTNLVSLSVTFDAGAGTVLIGSPISTPPTAVSSVVLTPSSESFAATAGGANPTPQAAAITNGGGGVLAGLSVSTVTYGAGQPTGWLGTPTLAGTAAPTTILLAPVTGSLPAGIHTATVNVVSSDTAVTPAQLPVSFTVSAGAAAPVMSTSSTTAAFAGTVGGTSPVAQTITVTNTGGGSIAGLAAAVSTGATWLTAVVSPATAPSTLTLNASLAGLAAGTYTGTVTLTSSAAGVAAKTVSVTLTMSAATAAPTLVLSATTAAYNATAGGTSPAPSTINIQNGGGGTLAGLATSIAYGAGATGWLAATLSATTAPSTLTLTPTLGSIAAGTYTATVTVSATGLAARTIGVTLTVAGAPALTVSATAATFSSAVSANPAQQQIQVTNSGGGTLSGLATSVSYVGASTGWLAATLSATSAPAVLTLAVTTGSRAAGTYTATVTVSGTGVTARSITVTHTITAAGLAVVIANFPALATVGGIAGSVGTVQGTPTTVVRTGTNTYEAYSLRCPHNGTTCRIKDGFMNSAFHCPNHDGDLLCTQRADAVIQHRVALHGHLLTRRGDPLVKGLLGGTPDDDSRRLPVQIVDAVERRIRQFQPDLTAGENGIAVIHRVNVIFIE